MYSYLAAISKNFNNYFYFDICERIRSTFPSYITSYSSNLISVFQHPNLSDQIIDTQVLPNKSGIATGRIFRKGLTSNNITENEIRLIFNTKGQYLTSNFWGRYNAILHDCSKNSTLIIQDPSGSLPMYYYENNSFIIVFTQMEDFYKLRLTELTFNLTHILSYGINHLLDYKDTGFNEIKKVIRGTSLSVDSHIVKHNTLWRAENFIDRDKKWEINDTQHELRETVEFCISMWARTVGKCGIMLSGGLDSTILLAALKKSLSLDDITAVHYYYPNGIDSDERKFARLAAETAGIRMIETDTGNNVDNLKNIQNTKQNAEPIGNLGSILTGPFNTSVASENSFSTYFMGYGGDMVFCQNGTHSVEDYLWYNGWNLGFIGQCINSSLLTKESAWRILIRSVSKHIFQKQPTISDILPLPEVDIFKKDILSDIDLESRLGHLTEGINNISLAKLNHVVNSRCIEYHESPRLYGQNYSVISPFISQPIVELVLSIPTWLFSYNGVSRGLIRRSFAQDIPSNIVKRQSKGGGEDYMERLFSHNKSFLREIFMEGELMNMGLLDNKSVESIFDPESSCNVLLKNRLLLCLDLEIWLRHWKNFV